MECGIEAGDLRQSRVARAQLADRRQIVGLMQRRQRRIALQTRQHLIVDQHRTVVVGAAMDDTMPGGNEIDGAASRAARRRPRESPPAGP